MVVALCLGLTIWINSGNHRRPQLNLTNTGPVSVTVSHAKDTFEVKPGQTWHLRFKRGDLLTARAGDAAQPREFVLNPQAVLGGQVSMQIEADASGGVNLTYRP
jgi:hypothetical protein